MILASFMSAPIVSWEIEESKFLILSLPLYRAQHGTSRLSPLVQVPEDLTIKPYLDSLMQRKIDENLLIQVYLQD